ncbi:MAG TPA: hypothetical protein VHM88_07165 [Candidatus Acidoferrales bacterium]|jgi:hypothetical protein|nr:hypothetical protein [Candidatus Acidoferrales bacterium]
MRIAEEGIGLANLAGEFALVVLLFHGEGMSLATWIGLYVITAIFAVACWHNEKAPQSVLGWFQMIAGSILIGVFFFAGDILVGYISHPSLPLIEAAEQAPFGFFLTLVACPGFTIIAVAGLVRTIFRTKLLARNGVPQ